MKVWKCQEPSQNLFCYTISSPQTKWFLNIFEISKLSRQKYVSENILDIIRYHALFPIELYCFHFLVGPLSWKNW